MIHQNTRLAFAVLDTGTYEQRIVSALQNGDLTTLEIAEAIQAYPGAITRSVLDLKARKVIAPTGENRRHPMTNRESAVLTLVGAA